MIKTPKGRNRKKGQTLVARKWVSELAERHPYPRAIETDRVIDLLKIRLPYGDDRQDEFNALWDYAACLADGVPREVARLVRVGLSTERPRRGGKHV